MAIVDSGRKSKKDKIMKRRNRVYKRGGQDRDKIRKIIFFFFLLVFLLLF